MAEENPQPRWEGKSVAEVRCFTAAQVWPLLADDFCSVHKLLPSLIDTCHCVEGAPGQPGLIRHCANSSTSTWANERLVAMDPREMWFTYEFMENSIGLGSSYQATIRVSPLVEGGGGGGCKIEWSFVSEPAEGWTLEGLGAFVESAIHDMSQNIDALLKSQEAP